MKQFFAAILLVIISVAAVQSFFPWWSMVVPTFIIGTLFPLKREAAWFVGVFGVFLLWLGYALYLSHANNGVLAARVAELLHPLTGGKTFRLFIMTGALGSLVGGFGCLTGRLTVMAIQLKRKAA